MRIIKVWKLILLLSFYAIALKITRSPLYIFRISEMLEGLGEPKMAAMIATQIIDICNPPDVDWDWRNLTSSNIEMMTQDPGDVILYSSMLKLLELEAIGQG